MKQAACILFSLAVCAWGQQQPSATPRGFGDLFNQAPPHVDQALRERIQAFYQLHQEKKFRAADKLVHEDSKDIFFEADKVTFNSFKIVGVTYEENYTRAKVVVDIDTEFFFPGFGKMPVHRPLTSTWKLDQDQWWWYVTPCDPNVGKDTPFNNMFKGCGAGSSSEAGPNPAPPGFPQDFAKFRAELVSKINVDKTEVVLPSHEPAEAEVVVTNGWENPVHLSVDVPDLPGLTLRIDKPVLEAGQKTSVKIISKPETAGAKPSLRAHILIEEISKVVPIAINYLPPPNKDPKPGTHIGPTTLPKQQ